MLESKNGNLSVDCSKTKADGGPTVWKSVRRQTNNSVWEYLVPGWGALKAHDAQTEPIDLYNDSECPLQTQITIADKGRGKLSNVFSSGASGDGTVLIVRDKTDSEGTGLGIECSSQGIVLYKLKGEKVVSTSIRN